MARRGDRVPEVWNGLLRLLAAILIALPIFAVAAWQARASGPIAMTEKGSSTLVWLERHPRPGTASSRAAVAAHAKRRVWRGLRLAGVYYPFMCIHRHESTDWHIFNPPYAGGMQEDFGFQGTYGTEYIRAFHGWANVWPPWAQVMAAFRAYHGYRGFAARGYTPWSTAGACGL